MSLTKELVLKRAKWLGYENFNIDNPETWCEKSQWLQLYDDISLRSKCADKLLLHEYAKEKIGMDICVPVIKTYTKPQDIRFAELPNQFVLKCNHGYGYNIICRSKSCLSETDCQTKMQQWLNTPFGYNSLEPHYLKIKRKCYAETYLKTRNQKELTDYKFLCFNGNPTYCQVINGRHTQDFHLNYYDMDFNFVDISRCDIKNNPNKIDIKPNKFETMVDYAKKLSNDFRFVRVDFYEVNDNVYLGELTFTPGTGFIRWTNPNVDKMFGDMIKL